ncbi:hypothetical protein CAMGR0001_2526 [Campylobacter gracilis RM3268]|uniref:Uncharacterized protein n=1 Tax=Campylobacter gracilis RM3268 TaxID=553220 RepID=C8PEN7_9BACT|nr:hypothetical protein CAMGR0001_2526 [Campylobacter gracilis RM3268]
MRQSGAAIGGDGLSCRWLAVYGLSRGGRVAPDSDTCGT